MSWNSPTIKKYEDMQGRIRHDKGNSTVVFVREAEVAGDNNDEQVCRWI